uniref:Putative LOC100876563 [Megachile rotundata] n=1 Tax=Lepeophtheirus salmonis TaxID=72036 RepID=A0A0K2SVS8_LEPSM
MMMMSMENNEGMDSMIIEAKRDIKAMLSSDSKRKVETIIQEVEKLSKFDRLLFYLELPSNQSNAPTDPLRGPLNPLGSRSEIQLTITWIKTHLEEDQQVSLPKHEVYDEYIEYCTTNLLKPLSTADFGKVMKQVYPQVRPRRLGTRGNSRYCYAGLKKKTKLEEPATPDFNFRKQEQTVSDTEDSVLVSASYLIREWVEKLLGVKFEGLKELAYYLLDKMYVDNKSYAAYALLSGKKNLKCTSQNDIVDHGNSQTLHILNHVKEREIKRKSQDLERYEVNSSMLYEEPESRKVLKLRKEENHQNDENESDILHKSTQPPPQPGEIKLEEGGKAPILSVYEEVTVADVDMTIMKKDESMWTAPGTTTSSNNAQTTLVPILNNNNEEVWLPVSSSTSIVNSVPHETVKPLWDSSKNDPDEEIGTYFPDNSIENDDKLSQLRQLLEKNLKSPTVGNSSAFKPTRSIKEDENEMEGRNSVLQHHDWSNPLPQETSNNNSLNSRRKVSFNPMVIDDPVQSPAIAAVNSNNSRKRNYGFQPISPRQTGSSQPPSPPSAASPFISPRSTPVPSVRSRHSSGNNMSLSLLPTTPNNRFVYGSNGSDISRAATFGSTSECSTPFISPQATPVHFSRSRHNSAQGRLCRSRHSSGVGYYKYVNNFSPVALNNLNNPFSPQPGTPMNLMDDSYTSSSSVQYFDSNDVMRSRHSSGGSEQSIQSAPISPTSNLMLQGGGGPLGGLEPRVRQRHASAGTVPTYGGELGGLSALVHSQQPSQQILPVTGENIILDSRTPNLLGGKGEKMMNDPLGKKELPVSSSGQNNMPDDLEMTVRVLKDFDNDFSQFCTDENVA